MESLNSPTLCVSGNFPGFHHDGMIQRARALKSKPSANCRRKREFISDEKKDASYWEKRRKNNEAAKRSREKRRFNDLVLENRVLALNEENVRLKTELLQLKLRFGLISTAAFMEKSQQLSTASASTASHFYGGRDNSMYSSSLSQAHHSEDSSETEQSSRDSGSVSAAKYSPRGSLSDMSDGSSRDSPVPQTFGEAQAVSRAYGEVPLQQQHHPHPPERKGPVPRGVILFSANGFTAVAPPQPLLPEQEEADSGGAESPEIPCLERDARCQAEELQAHPGFCSKSQSYSTPTSYLEGELTQVEHRRKAQEPGSPLEGYTSEESGEEASWGCSPAPFLGPPDAHLDVKTAALPHKLRLKCRAHSSGVQEPFPGPSTTPAGCCQETSPAADWDSERHEEMSALVRQALLLNEQPASSGTLERFLCRGSGLHSEDSGAKDRVSSWEDGCEDTGPRPT
ncbi:nuclear factor interleukin-3-regulated protein-like [Hemicordylus capensis]|uniref:nuclear factor interleukin-3-regulated protein-like n=1 Tax=Hemicordylus capensis TaxID=884348 RepID=UPI0023036FAC|nr:nuclear factor interleukin-3-regulated protein-like [Hemicordylus capensis]XP_053144239.1 nuclear factor interleukin-3-regulated protein-like [Hemicordylus capensis]XP_053144240.1 nuclear factor interleukin-3-regulated protein-like [Hemicordylus capensis]XP_053144241.1 nuclear factor interleukin-3-regulated protein-like [Hemicordylus capensis]XP_053144242.1 nuclear factor interleukin-3-regulated protein-like [Hemicordylus capensis]XP_053144243.1 nuclear factor interleukin-3-regulated protei